MVDEIVFVIMLNSSTNFMQSFIFVRCVEEDLQEIRIIVKVAVWPLRLKY